MKIYKISKAFYDRILHPEWSSPISALLSRADEREFKEGQTWILQAYCTECKKRHGKPVKVKITSAKKAIAKDLSDEDCTALGIFNKEKIKEIKEKGYKSGFEVMDKSYGLNNWCGQPWGVESGAIAAVFMEGGLDAVDACDAEVSMGYFKIEKELLK